jgi:hypothetical protein
VLRQVEDRIRAVQRATPGDSRAFLGLAERMARRLGNPGLEGPPVEGEPAPHGGSGSSAIIIP